MLALIASTSAFFVMPSTKSGVASQKSLHLSMPLRVNDPEDWPDHPYNDYDDYGPTRMSSPDGRNPIGHSSRNYHRETSMSRYDYNDYTPRRSPPPRRVWNDERDYRDDYDRDYRDERGFRDERGYGNTPPIGREPRSDRPSNQFDDYTPRTSPSVPKSAVRTYYPDGDRTFTPPVDDRDPGGPRHATQFEDYVPRGSVRPPSPPSRRGEFDDDRDYSRSVEYSRAGDNRRNDRYDDDYDSRSGSVPAPASRNDRDYRYDDDRNYPDDRYNERSRSRDRNDDWRDRRSDDRRDLYNKQGSVPQSARGSMYDDDRSRSFKDRGDDQRDLYNEPGSVPQPARGSTYDDDLSRSFNDRDDNRRDSYNESGSVPQSSARDSTYDDRRRNTNEYERYPSSRTSSPQHDSRRLNSGGINRSSSPVDNREPGGDWKTSRYGDYSTPTRSSAPVTRARANTDRPFTRPGNTRALNNREPNGQLSAQLESRKVWNANHNGRSPYSDHGLGNREPRGFRSTQPYKNYNSLPTKSSWNANRRGSASSADDREPGGQWDRSTYNDYSTPTRTGSTAESTMRPRPQSRMTSPSELEDNSSLGSMRGSGSDANFDPGRRSSTGSRSREPRASAFPETRAPPYSGSERRDGFGTPSTRDEPRAMPPPPTPRAMTPPATRAMPPPPAPRVMTPPVPRAMSPPPAPVPSPSSTTSRADRLGGPTTTMPSGGQSSAVGSAASYAEQMRATAPAESENVGNGASDAYLAAMSGAATTPQAMPPPPAPVPSSSSRADRLGGPSTTTVSGGQPAATVSAASYAEQMRATAPAESENVGNGASDAYLAAMAGVPSMPQVSRTPPPPPAPAPSERIERVRPSYTPTDSNTAAGADYLSMMGGGIPQKQPPKSPPKTASSGAAINTDIATASGSDYLSAMSGGGAPPPDWSQAKASSPSPAPAAAPAFGADSSRKGVAEIRVWFQGVLGQDKDFATLDAYANRIVDLGVDSIELLLAALTQADVKDFDWMSEPDKQRLIARGGLKK